MKFLLVVLSMLYRVNAQNILVSGCDYDLINRMQAYPFVPLQDLPPGVYFASTESEYTILIDSATLSVDPVINNQTSATVYLCIGGVAIPAIFIDYVQEDMKYIGNNFPILGEKADFHNIDCGFGLILTYLCDTAKPPGVGLIPAYAFTISAKPDTTVTPEGLAACKAVAKTLHPPATFTDLIFGGCQKL